MPLRQHADLLSGPAPSPSKSRRPSSRSSSSESPTFTSLRRRSVDWYALRLLSTPLTPPTSPDETTVDGHLASADCPAPSCRASSSSKASLFASSQPTASTATPPSKKPFRMPSLGNMARQSGLSRFTRRSTASSERISAGAREAAQQHQRDRDNASVTSPSSSGHSSSTTSGAFSRIEQFSLRSMRDQDGEVEKRASSNTPGQERRNHQTVDSPTCRSFNERYGDPSRPPSDDEPPHRALRQSSKAGLASPSRPSPRLPRLGRRPKTAENRVPAKFGMTDAATGPSRSSPRPRTSTLTSSTASPRLGDLNSLWDEIDLPRSPAGSFATTVLPSANGSPPSASLRSRSSVHKDRAASSGTASASIGGHSPLEPRHLLSQLGLVGVGLPSSSLGLGISLHGGLPGREDENWVQARLAATDAEALRREFNERLGSVECFGDSYAKHLNLPTASAMSQSGLSPPPRPKRRLKGQGHSRGVVSLSSPNKGGASGNGSVEVLKLESARRTGHHRLRLSISENGRWDDAASSSHSRSSSSSSASIPVVTVRAADGRASTHLERRSSRKAPQAGLRLSPLSEDDLNLQLATSFLETARQLTPSPTLPSAELSSRSVKPSLLLPASPPLSPSATTDVAIAHANDGLRERIDHLKSLRQRERDLRDNLHDTVIKALARGESHPGSPTPKPRNSPFLAVEPMMASPAASAAVSLPGTEVATDCDDLEDYWSIESHSFTGPSPLSLSASPASTTNKSPCPMSPPLVARASLSQHVAPVPPRGLMEAGLSEEEALKARLRWVNDQITEACRAIATAALRSVSDDGLPPHLDSARSARTFSILRDPRLASLAPERRHHYLDELLLHVVLSTLQREMCEPFCFGYSRDDTAHATRLINMVWSQTPSEATTVQRTLHRSMRQSLAAHLRSAYRSNVRTKLHGSINLVLAWTGLVAKPSESNQYVAKVSAALKASVEELGHIIDDAREAGGVESARNSPELHLSMLPSTAVGRASNPAIAIASSTSTARDSFGLLPGSPRIGGRPAAAPGAYDICLAAEQEGRGLLVAKGLGITQRISSSAHRVALLPRSTVILDL